MREREENITEQYVPTEGLTLEEDRELVALLSKWTGGRISTPVFTELARIIPQPIVEVVVFRKNNDTLETLLIPRPADDIVWPGMFHNPGAAIRTSDFNRNDNDPLAGVFERIQKGELSGDFSYRPEFVSWNHRLSVRGPEVAQIYYTEMAEETSEEQSYVWYSVDKLAENEKFIQGQLPHIKMAAKKYLEERP